MARLNTVSEWIGLSELQSPTLYRGLVAEFLGSLLLVLVGCGCARGADVSVEAIALAFGLGVATIVAVIADVSGGHINPAVTVGLLAGRCVSVLRAVLYVAVQMAGATVGAGILYGLLPDTLLGSLGNTIIKDELTTAQGFGIEMLITFILVLTVYAVCDDRRGDLKGSGPVAIGFAVTACHLFAIPLTGASMNPCRSFGPAVVMGGEYWDNHWVYWVGPCTGGAVAGLLYSYVFRSEKKSNNVGDMEIRPTHA